LYGSELVAGAAACNDGIAIRTSNTVFIDILRNEIYDLELILISQIKENVFNLLRNATIEQVSLACKLLISQNVVIEFQRQGLETMMTGKREAWE